ncbi:MAG: hypothetical protein M3Y74_22385, partial [Chloroflexota bacterium]|nr:hypothetical protein [Chloroflexota bacterium]
KHPALYRRHVQAAPPWRYYVAVAALLTVVASHARQRRACALLAALIWLIVTARFCAGRLRGTSHAPRHVVEMAVTSVALATKLGLAPMGERLAYQQAEETITIENRLEETVYVHVEGPLGRERRAELPAGGTCRRRALRGQRWVAYMGDRRVAAHDVGPGARTWVIARTVPSD